MGCMNEKLARRQFFKAASTALAMIPIMVLSTHADAATNAAIRTALKYQNTPKEDGSKCLTCLEFIAGKTENDLGSCKIIPGDNEISSNGYCTGWNTM